MKLVLIFPHLLVVVESVAFLFKVLDLSLKIFKKFLVPYQAQLDLHKMLQQCIFIVALVGDK
jgi:hypothetical protein